MKEKLKQRMASLCSRAEHCRYEIEQKLRKARLPSGDIREIIEFLTQERFIDDARFARAFANDKVRFASWGSYKIRMALAAKRLPSSVIAGALDSIDEEEYSAALRRAAEAKSKTLSLQEREDRAKLYRHLMARGFESSLVAPMVSEMARNKE